MRYQILKVTQVSLDVGQKEQNANSVNILFGLSTQKHITSADLQITQVERLRTLKQLHQAANFLKVFDMNNNDFEAWFLNQYGVHYKHAKVQFDHAQETYFAWKDCQQLNDKRIADLLALVAKKDALISQCIEENGYLADGDNCTLKPIIDALAITADGFKLVEYAEIWNHGDGKAGIKYKNDLRKGDMIHGTKLYTIKQKE